MNICKVSVKSSPHYNQSYLHEITSLILRRLSQMKEEDRNLWTDRIKDYRLILAKTSI